MSSSHTNQETCSELKSIGENCNDLKSKYDSCFNQWFSEKFLRGHTDDSMCKPLFKLYNHCVKEAIQHHQIDMKDLDGNHIDGKEFENVKTTPEDSKES